MPNYLALSLSVFFLSYTHISNTCLYSQKGLPGFNITQLTPDDGLSQGSNYFRFEDSKGFMWLTANDALNRFDGVKVKVYNLDRYFKDCPPLQQGYGFVEDDQSNIYVGSVRGLYVYHRDIDRFTLHNVFTGGVDDIAMPICFKDGKIWCFNRQYQLATFDIKTGKSVLVDKLPLKELTSIHIYQLRNNVFYSRYPFLDSSGQIWMVGENKVIAYDCEKKEIIETLGDLKIGKETVFFSSAYDPYEKKIFLGTNDGIYIFDEISKKALLVDKVNNGTIKLVSEIAVNKDLVVFKCEAGLSIADKKFKKVNWEVIKGMSRYKRSYQYGFDKGNRLWICDDGLGQIIISFKKKIMEKEPNENTAINYFFSHGISRFAEFPDGSIAVPTTYKYLFMLAVHDRKNGTTSKLSFPDLEKEQFYGCITDEKRKGIWLYSENVPTYKQLTNFFFIDNDKRLSNSVKLNVHEQVGHQNDMLVLPSGNILCSFAKGLFWLDLEHKKLTPVEEEKQPGPFKINLVSKGRIAVSYLNGDMMLYQVGQGFSLKPLHKILAGVQSFYLQEDTVSHRFWVGTNEGVYILDEKFKTIKKINANNGLAGTYIYGLLLDDQGNAYCSHQRGLSSISGEKFHVLNFDKSDGIQDWDFNNRAYIKASDGTMYFGGGSGFNYFKPPVLPVSFYQPEVYVDEFLVNGISYNTDKCANLITEVRLGAVENNIEIVAIVKDLENARSRKLVYRLKETDFNWTFLPNNNSILFNNLAPGRYTLELGTYDKYSNKMLIQKKIGITVEAPFYATTWFLFLVASVSTAAVFLVIGSIKESRRRSKLREQQGLEEQRRAITADLHDDIGASLSSLQINSSVARRLMDSDSSQAHSFLEKIENQSQDLADKIGDIIWSMKPGEQEFMTMSSRIKNFVNDILGATPISYTVDIEPEIDSLAQSIPLRKNLIMIAKESVNNAAKYSQASKLELTLRVEGTNLLLLVKDNGVGFEANGTQGNGLHNMKKRALELGGKLTITSKIGIGTEVNLSVPYP